jgi:psiF repeat
MIRCAIVAGLLIVTLPSACFALSNKDKMATCKFGADDQHLQGAERDTFIKKCMSGKNDPRGPAGASEPAAPKN